MPKLNFGQAFICLAGDVHLFDWYDARGIPPARPAEDFVTVGREKFRGVDCWKLVTTNNQGNWPMRWFVGVADNRLYGIWQGAAGDPAQNLEMAREEALADGFEIKTEEDARTWYQNLSKGQQEVVREKNLEWVGRRGLPALESWLGDYVELQPGIWFPRGQGYLVYSSEKADGTYGGPVHQDDIDEYTATDVRIDEGIAEGTFEVSALHVPEGTQVWDSTHTPALRYNYKASFSPEEWQAILDAADKRQKRIDQQIAAQQQARAAAEAAERAKQNQQGAGGGP